VGSAWTAVASAQNREGLETANEGWKMKPIIQKEKQFGT
jgi:hypothetical protein